MWSACVVVSLDYAHRIRKTVLHPRQLKSAGPTSGLMDIYHSRREVLDLSEALAGFLVYFTFIPCLFRKSQTAASASLQYTYGR